MRCSKCGDKIRRLSRNKWGCINCMWHGRSKRRPITVMDLFAAAHLMRVTQAIQRIVGGKQDVKR